MGFATFLWILDNLMALLFFKSHKNSQRGIPKDIVSISVAENEYYQLQSRIAAFKTSLLYGSSNQIKLSSCDINLSLRGMYLERLGESFDKRAFDRLEVFDIRQDEIIIVEFLSFLLLDIQPICALKKSVKFELHNGEVLELQRISHKLADNNTEPQYIPVKNEFASNLIYRILCSSNLYSGEKYLVGSPRIQSRIVAAPLVHQLKQVCVINNELVLRS